MTENTWTLRGEFLPRARCRNNCKDSQIGRRASTVQLDLINQHGTVVETTVVCLSCAAVILNVVVVTVRRWTVRLGRQREVWKRERGAWFKRERERAVGVSATYQQIEHWKSSGDFHTRSTLWYADHPIPRIAARPGRSGHVL